MFFSARKVGTLTSCAVPRRILGNGSYCCREEGLAAPIPRRGATKLLDGLAGCFPFRKAAVCKCSSLFFLERFNSLETSLEHIDKSIPPFVIAHCAVDPFSTFLKNFFSPVEVASVFMAIA